jgi:hypothetical protein
MRQLNTAPKWGRVAKRVKFEDVLARCSPHLMEEPGALGKGEEFSLSERTAKNKPGPESDLNYHS